MGTSLLEQHTQRGILITRDDMVGRVENGALLMHNLKRTVKFEGDASRQADMEHKLQAQVQLLMDSLEHNTLMSTKVHAESFD